MKKTNIISLLVIFSTFLFCSQSTITQAMGWEVTNGTPQFTNFKSVTLSNELFLKHELAVRNPRKVLVNGDSLYYVDSNQTKVTAISIDTKAIKWEFTPPNAIFDLAIVNNHIAVSTNSKTYFLKDEGFQKSIVWESDAWGNYINFDDQMIYTTNSSALSAINIQTGKTKWSYSIPSTNSITSSTSVSKNGLFLVMNDRRELGYKLFAINKQTGQVLWTSHYPNPERVPTIVNERVLLSYHNKVSMVLTSNGSTALNKTIGTEIFSGSDESVSTNGELIFARTNKGKIIGFDPTTGEIRFQQDYRGGSYTEMVPFSSGPILVTANQLIIENAGKLKFFNSKTGKPEHVISRGETRMEPVLFTDRYLIAKNSEKLYVYAPPVDPQYKDPDGDAQKEQPPAPHPDEKQLIYTVKPGDTLWKIAIQYGTTYQKIADINKVDPNTYIWIGQNLTLPKPQKIHVVQAGDVLWKIASQYGVTIQSIIDENKLSNPSHIYITQRLIIPEPN